MKRFIEGDNIYEVINLVFDVAEDRTFTTTNALMKELKLQGLKIEDYANGEYIVVEYKGDNYIIFITSKPIEVISVEHDVDTHHIVGNDDKDKKNKE